MKNQNKNEWLEISKIGLIGGVVCILLSLIGMVETFNGRDIINGIISMGQTLLVLTLAVMGYFAAKIGLEKEYQMGPIVAGAVSGAAAGLVVGLLVLVGQVVDLRQVLINASPALYEILTFNAGIGTGFVLLLVVGALLGATAGGIHLLTPTIRRLVLLSLTWVGVVGLLRDLIRVTLDDISSGLSRSFRWMFGTTTAGGLSIIGTIVVIALVVTISIGWSRQRPKWEARFKAMPAGQQQRTRWMGLALIGLLLLLLPTVMGSILSDVVVTVGIFILMGLGLNIVVGFAGLLDLGYVAFFAIGAYVMGILTTTGGELAFSFGWTFWEALPVAVLTAVIAGIILGIPVLHIRGDYLAIVTLGFGEIIRILALSDMLKPYIGGSQGIVELARGEIGPIRFDTPQTLYYLVLVACLLAAFVAYRLKDSRIGRTWMALREDEDVAQAMGIDLVQTKLLAFGTGAAFSGLAGAIFASKLGTIYPHSFQLLISINALALVIVGGMGSIPGVVIGAVALAGLPELFREFAEVRLLVFGAALMGMMLLRPEGLWPEEARRRELHSNDEPIPQAE